MNAETLTHAFTAARQAAEAVESNDGGTCNLDTPIVYLNGVRRTVVEEAAEAAGINVDKTRFFGRPCWFVFVPMRGQAELRSKCAEAACRALKAQGLESSVWYQAD